MTIPKTKTESMKNREIEWQAELANHKPFYQDATGQARFPDSKLIAIYMDPSAKKKGR
jgi:hypothetical protein